MAIKLVKQEEFTQQNAELLNQTCAAKKLGILEVNNDTDFAKLDNVTKNILNLEEVGRVEYEIELNFYTNNQIFSGGRYKIDGFDFFLNGKKYGSQLAIGYTLNYPLYRKRSADIWSNWEPLVTSTELNALFEQGTWTPKITGTDSGNTEPIYATNPRGTYSKSGKIVTCTINNLDVKNFDGISGTLKITGFPFNPKNSYSAGSLAYMKGIPLSYTQVPLPYFAGISIVFYKKTTDYTQTDRVTIAELSASEAKPWGIEGLSITYEIA